MDEQPRNVKELLVEAKDTSELMIDLAYAAVFFDEQKLAREVERLEQRMRVNLVREIVGAQPLPPGPSSEGPPLSELDRAVDILVELKNTAEAAVGLAYSALLFNDRALAAEVSTLEARSDMLHDELESWALRAAPEARNPDELRGLLRIASASESICDAARDMTWYVEKGEELHPVIQMALD